MDKKNICDKVSEVAKEAGKFIYDESQKFSSDNIEFKGENDLVSYVDKTAEEKIVRKLTEILPEAGFITEEKTKNKKGKKFDWVIDPLDGTTNFIHGLPIYCVSIALFEDNKPIIGVIYEIVRDELFTAYKDGGAYLNGKKVRVSSNEKLSSSLVTTGFPYSLLDKEEAFFNIMKEMVKISRGIRRLGSAAADLAYVACGRVEMYYEFNVNLWDIAAGIIILQEAGGKVTDFKDAYSFNKESGLEIVATNSKIHAEAIELIQKKWN